MKTTARLFQAAAAAAAAAAVLAVPASASSAPRLVLPPPAGQADYQLGDAYDPPAGTRIVERDRTVLPAPGAYGVCYLNGYQTQPAESDWWQAQHPELLLRDGAGQTVSDPGWPGELLLDTSTAAKRAGILNVESGWVDGCARSGYAAVEADNLDSWTRSRGLLSRDANVALARLLNAYAHQDGLASAQKNSPELAPQGHELGFDFAVAEECGVYDECAAYTAAYGPQVIEVEYTDNGAAAYDRSCAAAAGSRSILLRDRQLGSPGTAGYTYRSC